MSPCLLLVHDSNADAAVVAEVAASLGLTVLHARPAAESLKLFGTRRPAWVLLCPSAEGGRGATLLAELKRHPYGGRARFLLLGDGVVGGAVDDVEPLPLDAGRLAAQLRGAADGKSPTQREAIAAAAMDAAMKLGGERRAVDALAARNEPPADAPPRHGEPGVRLDAAENAPRSDAEPGVRSPQREVRLDAAAIAPRTEGGAGERHLESEAPRGRGDSSSHSSGARPSQAAGRPGSSSNTVESGVHAAQEGVRLLGAVANAPRSDGEPTPADVRPGLASAASRRAGESSPRPDARPLHVEVRSDVVPAAPRAGGDISSRSGLSPPPVEVRPDVARLHPRDEREVPSPAGVGPARADAHRDPAPGAPHGTAAPASAASTVQVSAGTSRELRDGASPADVRSRLERASALWERAALQVETPARRVPVSGLAPGGATRARESGDSAQSPSLELRRGTAPGPAVAGTTNVRTGDSVAAEVPGALPDGAPSPKDLEVGGPAGVLSPDAREPGAGRPPESPPKPFEIGRLTARVREALLSEASASADASTPASVSDPAAAPVVPASHVVALPPRLEPGAGEEPLEPFARRLCAWAGDGRLQQLHLEDDAGRGRWLWLEHGRVVAASSSVAAESLLERARLDGLVTAAELATLRDLRRASANEQLSALRGRGWVRGDEVDPLLLRHLRAVVLEALAATRIRFERVPADGLPGEVPAVPVGVPALALLVESLRRRTVAAEVLERIGGVGARVVPLPHLLPQGALELTPRERSWWEGWEASGGTVEALLLGSGLREEAAWGLLAALEVLGALELQPPEQRAPASLGVRELERLQAKLQEVARADYFEVLGLPRTAGTGEVLRAWETLRAEFEPLKYVGHPDAGLVRDAQAVCAALDEAVRALRDDRLRAAYARYLVG